METATFTETGYEDWAPLTNSRVFIGDGNKRNIKCVRNEQERVSGCYIAEVDASFRAVQLLESDAEMTKVRLGDPG